MALSAGKWEKTPPAGSPGWVAAVCRATPSFLACPLLLWFLTKEIHTGAASTKLVPTAIFTLMISFDPKHSVNKSMFLKSMQLTHSNGQYLQHVDAAGESDQHLIMSALREIEDNNEKSAVGLVNALFLSSTSHSLDKVCLNIFAKMGDEKSLHLLYKKYPTPDSISISLLPYYIGAVGFLGGEPEIDLLARLSATFWGLYRAEILNALEQISGRCGSVRISDATVSALQNLYDAADEAERIQILRLCPRYENQLLLSVVLCGVESEFTEVRRAAIAGLAAIDSHSARIALQRAFLNETDERLLEDFEPGIFGISS
jgi:hypothetical protein